MEKNKKVRSVCYFSSTIDNSVEKRLNSLEKNLTNSGFVVQTKRACFPKTILEIDQSQFEDIAYLSAGSLDFHQTNQEFDVFKKSDKNISFNIDLTSIEIKRKHVDILFDLIKNQPDKTFLFTYVFNNQASSPFFPSASYEKDGFSIGLQPTDLSVDCNSLEEWFEKTNEVWQEIFELFSEDEEFLGIDSSTAPLLGDAGSLIGFLERLNISLTTATTSDTFLKITSFLKESNPKPIGLCGLMLPCLEDTQLARQYEQGNFSIERNIFLSLHSGLGIDTYPIGVNEKAERVVQILKLIQGLSKKYQKPLSARFVSDGKTKIGEKSDFQNEYLQDVVISKL